MQRPQPLPGPVDPRPDRADGAPAHLGGLGVLEAHHHGEHERAPLVRVQTVEEIEHGDLLVGARRVVRARCPERVEASPSDATAHVVRADVPGDPEQPGPERGVTPVPVERVDRPQVGVLGEVLGLAGGPQVGAEPQDVGLGRPDEGGERPIVTEAGGGGEFGQVAIVHRAPNLSARPGGPAAHESADARNSGAGSHDRGGMDRPLAPPRDLAARVTAAAARRDRDAVRGALRIGLVLVAVAELVIAVPGLILGHGLGHPDPDHIVRHASAFAIAYAIGLLFIAHRPARARAFVPLTIALAVAVVVGTAGDVIADGVEAAYEFQHLLELAGMALVWILASRPLWARPTAMSPATGAGTAGDDGTPKASVLRLPERTEAPHGVRRSG